MGYKSINVKKNVIPTAARKDVKVNEIFQSLDANGKPTGDKFVHFGYGDHLAKFFSVAITGNKNGALCGSPDGRRIVAVVGVATLEVIFLRKGTEVKTTRTRLEPGDVFQVPQPKAERKGAKPSLYVHLGMVNNDRWTLSYNLNTKKLAIGTKLNGAVRKVGDINVATKVSG